MEDAIEQAVTFVGALEEHGFKVSSKSLLVSSDPKLSKCVQKRLQAEGVDIQVAESEILGSTLEAVCAGEWSSSAAGSEL